MIPRATILLTGFGPFPGVPVNATATFVPQLAAMARQRFPSAIVVAEILPTEWQEAPRRLSELLEAHDPVLAAHFGVAVEARGLTIEMMAYNATCAKVDACGALPASPSVLERAPEALATPLPADAMLSRLAELGVPASISRDAGRYLCNAVLYRSLHHATTRAPRLRALFVHVPVGLAERGSARSASAEGPLDWPSALAGALEILEVAAESVAAPAPSSC
jgi:pyroglutamyl-peptidase